MSEQLYKSFMILHIKNLRSDKERQDKYANRIAKEIKCEIGDQYATKVI